MGAGMFMPVQAMPVQAMPMQAAQPTAPPQYSPDGRWWWNGQQWLPVAAPTAGSV